MCVAILAVFHKVQAGCFAANTSSFAWCSGYSKVGYNCSSDGTACASATALAQSYFCALNSDAVLHAPTGQCCDSVADGKCQGPRSGTVHGNFPYGPVDHKPAEIIEGCVQYSNGPKCFGKDAPFGDYGFTANYPNENQPGGCPPLPTNFDKSKVRVNKMSEAIGSPYSGCFVECNLTEVSATGVDPCSPGDFSSATSGHNTMKCYSGGAKFVKPFPSGICAFNCTLVYPDTRKPCSNNSVYSTCVLTCTDSAV